MLYSKVSVVQLNRQTYTAIMEISNLLEKVFILTFLATPVDVAKPEDDLNIGYSSGHAEICSKHLCYRISYTALKTNFPERFMTKEDYGKIYKLPYMDETNTRRIIGQPDGDQCCETTRYFTIVPNKVWISGKPCYVIHCEGINEYQYMPSGTCSPTRGSCDGSCLPETAVHSVVCVQVVWFFWKFRIAYLETTAYCSCKNISG